MLVWPGVKGISPSNKFFAITALVQPLGLMKRKMLFLIAALVCQYVSDFTFLYMASRGLPYVGGVVDYLYLMSYFLMTLAIIELDSAFERSKNGKTVEVNRSI